MFSKMRWIDPAFRTSDKEFGIDDINIIANHFEEPPSLASFDISRALKQWKSFKNYVRSYYTKLPEAKPLLQSILYNRRKEFPNLCKLASLIISISGSNSAIERTFSVVTNILSDKRLSMQHNTINEALIVYGNDSLWSTEERESIIDRVIEIYTESKRRRKADQSPKRQRLDDEEPQLDNDGSSDEVMVSSSHTDIDTDSKLTDSELGDMQEVMDYDSGSSSESQ